MDSKLIQEGTYGCVVSPPLPCSSGPSGLSGPKGPKEPKEPKTPQQTRTVGKIIRKKNSVNELKISTLVKSIPGYARYYIVQEKDDCSTKDFSELRNKYQQQCKVYRQTASDQLVQLVSPYAGSPIRSLGITDSFDFIGSLRHVLEGVSKLEEQGICHFDLHNGNVLVDFKGTFRFIDFGSAFLGDLVDEKVVMKHVYEFSPDFPPQPPEMSVQNGIHQGLTVLESITQTMKQKRELSLAHKLLGLSVVTQEAELRNFWEDDTTWKGDEWTPFFKQYWRKWDSWAVGVLFLHILQKCFLHQGFIMNTWTKNHAVIRTVLKGLLNSEPNGRFSAIDALNVLNYERKE